MSPGFQKKVAVFGLLAGLALVAHHARDPKLGFAWDRPQVDLKLSYSAFSRYQRRLTRSQVETRISRFLLKTPGSDIEKYYSVTDQAFSIFESSGKKEAGEPEFTLLLRQGEAAEPPVSTALGKWRPGKDTRRPLHGLRVALDPGHLGGEVAGYRKPEDRYVWMKDSGAEFNEGTLAFLTARQLKRLLVSEGAEVLITRDAIGEGAEGIPYSYWLSAYFKQDLEEFLQNAYTNDMDREKARAAATDPSLPTGPMKVFNWRDLRLRGQKINAFKPHLTLIMHYNAGAAAKDAEGRDVGLQDNLLMTFVPGSFMNGELADQPSRYNFVRALVTDDVRESAAFSREVLEQLTQALHVNIAPPDCQAPYLVNGAMLLEPGVYARNLGMNRFVKGRLCYAEPLFQDNFDESLRLARKDVLIDGIPTSSRILTVAEAYHQAILEMAAQARSGRKGPGAKVLHWLHLR
jgi:N-acetylmuramoyl-L-alanine amidase